MAAGLASKAARTAAETRAFLFNLDVSRLVMVDPCGG
jgi:hypothetical protein